MEKHSSLFVLFITAVGDFVIIKPFNRSLMFTSNASLANIRLRRNTLAYLSSSSVTDISKSFIGLTPGEVDRFAALKIKMFFFSKNTIFVWAVLADTGKLWQDWQTRACKNR
jgi:hypothetical protein